MEPMKLTDLSIIENIGELRVDTGMSMAKRKVAASRYYSEYGSSKNIQPEKPSAGASESSMGFEKDKG